MGGSPAFGGVVGGLSQITKGLADAAVAAGAEIRMGVTVKDVKHGSTYRVLTDQGVVEADRVILAMPAGALRRLPVMRTFRPLRHLKMEPLTRIYAKMVRPWPFKSRIITDSPLRYIIPISKKIVMISYTEAQDTRRWLGLKGPALIAALQTELRRLGLVSDLVSEVEWARAYEWDEGCTYWIPGPYDPATESKAALTPFASMPHLHVVGESFSLRQAWMEGALEHAAMLWPLLKH
jgi:glycine/D-amino acid oxidase-like deaminating enzyme